MERNVEIKAKVVELAAVRQVVEGLADSGPMEIEQEDTFFICRRGRLKLRRFVGCSQAELIYYERPEGSGPKESRYVVHPTADPDGLGEVLSAALGVRGVVRKRRTVYLVGQTRVYPLIAYRTRASRTDVRCLWAKSDEFTPQGAIPRPHQR